MTVELMKAEIDQIDGEMKKLKQRKKNLQAEILKKKEQPNQTFEEKFKNYIRSNKGKMLPWVPDEDEYPKLTAFIDKYYSGLDRYDTYKFKDMFSDEIDRLVATPEEKLQDWYTRHDTDYAKAVDANFREVAQEIMEKNIRGFKNDW